MIYTKREYELGANEKDILDKSLEVKDGIIKGESKCRMCNKYISWYDVIKSVDKVPNNEVVRGEVYIPVEASETPHYNNRLQTISAKVKIRCPECGFKFEKDIKILTKKFE